MYNGRPEEGEEVEFSRYLHDSYMEAKAIPTPCYLSHLSNEVLQYCWMGTNPIAHGAARDNDIAILSKL